MKRKLNSYLRRSSNSFFFFLQVSKSEKEPILIMTYMMPMLIWATGLDLILDLVIYVGVILLQYLFSFIQHIFLNPFLGTQRY